MNIKSVARGVSIGALFLITLIPLIVAQDVGTTFSEVHGLFSGLIISIIALLRVPFFLTGGYTNLFFPYITGKAIAFRILVEIAFAGWAVLVLLDKRYRPQFSWLGALLTIFVVWMFIADAFAINPEKAFWSNFERMEGWVTLIHLYALFVVSSSVLTVNNLWRKFWLTSLGVSFVVGLYGLLQIAGLATIHQGGVRLDATLGNAEYLSAYFLFHIFIAAWLTVKEYKDKTWLRYALPLLALFETYLLFETQTRGAVLGLIAGAFVAAGIAAVVAGGKARTYAASATVAVLVLAGGFFLLRNASFVQDSPALTRIASISLDQGSTRFTLWHMAYEGFLVHPVLGWGQEGYNYVFNRFFEPSLYGQEDWFDRAHNWFIDWLVAGGLPAFLLAISLFVASVWQLARSKFTRSEKAGIAGVLAAYAVYAVFVFDNLVTAVLFILVIAYVHARSARPIAYFEKLPELAEENATTLAIPVIAVALCAVIYFVNVPGLRAGSELITALTPQPTGIPGTVAVFEDLLSHPAWGAQEIREQLVSVAVQIADSSTASSADKASIGNLAVSEMQKQIQATPMDARGYLELALAYRVVGDEADAFKQDEAAAALSPNKETIYIEEGSSLESAGNATAAKTAYDKAYALGPEFPQLAAYAAAGDILTGDAPGAQALLLKNFGTTTVDNEQIILAYYLTKDWANLITLLTQYVADQHGSANAYFRLASGYVSAGNLAAAKQAVEAGIKSDPSAATEGQTLLTELAAMGAR